jgi:hypothetical protein
VSLFLFRDTRGSSVPKEIFGEGPLFGFLVVDRYNGYNFIKCRIQYCYAHLEREVKDLLKEFPDQAEVKVFGDVFIPLLSSAMSLHSEPLSDEAYTEKAVQLKQKIVAAVEAPAQHPGIQRIQDIFRDHADRMYQWVEDRDVPADNNRVKDPEEHLKRVLDLLARDIHQDPFPLLFGKLPCMGPESVEIPIIPHATADAPQAWVLAEPNPRGP